jgi:hypothetical protein
MRFFLYIPTQPLVRGQMAMVDGKSI